MAAVHELFEASTRPQLRDALGEVFVEHLGYTPSKLDETQRLAGQTTLTHASVVARYEQFTVVVVESTYAGPYLSSYERIFALHPRALVFALEPGVRVRVISRQVGGSGHLLGSRVLHGRGKRSFPTDDPVIWARRLALLDPQPQDDDRSLAQRAHELLACSAADLCSDWDPRPTRAGELPGCAWEQAPDLELEQFLQTSHTEVQERICFGLEAELRACFPWRSRDGLWVDYTDYRVQSVHRDAAEAIRTKACTRVVIELDLEVVTAKAEAEASSMTVPFSIVVPDSEGRFVLHGRLLTFWPKTEPLETWDNEGDDFNEQDETEGENESPLPSLDPDDDEDNEWSGPQEYAHPNAYTGAGLTPLLRWAVGRRLRWYGWKLSKLRPSNPLTSHAVRAWLGRWRDEHGATRAFSYAVLNHHLQPPVVADLRVLAIDRVAPPPAWACLDLTSALPPGFAYPVAGARLGPGGVLAAPTLTEAGGLQLLTRPANATRINPRTRGPGSSPHRTSFIATPLEAWSTLPAGALEDPMAALASPTSGPFLRSPGPELRVLLPISERPRTSRATWHIDIPAHFDVREAPEIVVEVGQTIEPGTELIRVPPHTWGTEPDPLPHRLRTVADIIARRNSEVAGHRIYAPPSLRGRLLEVESIEIRDADGTLLTRRVSFETLASKRLDRAVLPDGRVALVEFVGPAELPWSTRDGEPALGLVLDPEAEPSEPSAEQEPQWIEGTTGEPLRIVEPVAELTLTSRRPVEPDPALGIRVVDNWGQPRASDDATLTTAYLRWLQAAHPGLAAELYNATVDHVGVLPAATSAAQLAAASQTPLPFFAPEPPEFDPDATRTAPLGIYDPRRRAGHPERWCGTRSSGGIWEWRCECGQLRGPTYAGMTCASCGGVVSREPIAEPLHDCPLPVRVVHPWRRSLVAALLGLTEAELRPIMQTEDCSELANLTAVALDQPHRNLHQRIAQTEDQELLTALLQQHAELDAALCHGLELNDLWLSRLSVLSPRLLFDGYRMGAADLGQSPLTKHYRSITAVSELTSGRVELLPQLRRAQWIELQGRVDQLFGSVEHGEAGTLAEYWRRVWPTTVHGSVPLSVPGLCVDMTPDELNQSSTRILWPGAMLEGSRLHQLAVLTPTGLLELPPQPQPEFDLTSDQAWTERGAWAELLDRHSTWLAAVLLGADGHPRASQALRAIVPPDLADSSSLGRVLLRELIRGLAPPAGRPSKLFELVLAPRPLRLPRADQAASEAIEQRLAGLVDGDDTAALTSARALAVLLGGFWQGTPSTEHPAGWLWSHTEHEVPKSFRRVVPRLADGAWQAWPDFDLMMHPLRALARGSVVHPRSPGVRAWFGLDGEELPVDIDWGEVRAPVAPPEPPDTTPVPPPLPKDASDQAAADPAVPQGPQATHFTQEVVVVDVSLQTWLAAQRS
ncbi:hypothetical protein PPSIR1_22184 [Plesiocystis pacifica SIR-1]|uniref:AP2/ERF domain-containing protein n=1 Tax=Plesiocystis pacifica SIR-1 TaxID=391625 RepID=A6FXT4_9BACT|nr:hypothetical protein PPSIR1_22184 [Plesiocystis pacifica SIR-1]